MAEDAQRRRIDRFDAAVAVDDDHTFLELRHHRGEMLFRTALSGLGAANRGQIVDDHLIGESALPHGEHRDRLDVDGLAVAADQCHLRGFGGVAGAIESRDALAHRRDIAIRHELNDRMPDHLIHTGSVEQSHDGRVRVDDDAVLMDDDTVGAVLDQGAVPLSEQLGIGYCVGPVITCLNHMYPLIMDCSGRSAHGIVLIVPHSSPWRREYGFDHSSGSVSGL